MEQIVWFFIYVAAGFTLAALALLFVVGFLGWLALPWLIAARLLIGVARLAWRAGTAVSGALRSGVRLAKRLRSPAREVMVLPPEAGHEHAAPWAEADLATVARDAALNPRAAREWLRRAGYGDRVVPLTDAQIVAVVVSFHAQMTAAGRRFA